MKQFTQRWRDERADRLQGLMEESAKESESMRQTAMHLSEQRDRLQAEVEDWKKEAKKWELKCAELEKGIKLVYEYVNDGPDPISLWTVALKLEALLTPAPPEEKRP